MKLLSQLIQLTNRREACWRISLPGQSVGFGYVIHLEIFESDGSLLVGESPQCLEFKLFLWALTDWAFKSVDED